MPTVCDGARRYERLVADSDHSPHTRGFRALVSEAQWRQLLGRGVVRDIPSGTRLLHQGEHSRVVYALTRGRVRVVYTEDNGDEALIAIRGPGDLLGEYAQRDRREHMASVWTLENCRAAILGADAFEGFIGRHALVEPLHRYMLGKARQIGVRMWRAANLQTEQRMAQLFIEVLDAAPPSSAATVPMTQAQVASSLGVARSSVARLLAQWKEAGLVRIRPSRIELTDRAALVRRANPR
jgi:CRP/FNR family transcriptional regulator, cyclic AMP receptor protein